MALTVISNAKVVVNSVDLSDHVKQVNVSHAAKPEPATTMGQDTENALPGLKISSIEIEFLQDYAAGKVDATCFPLVGPGVVPFPVAVNPVNAVNSATNPSFNGYFMLESYPPLGVAVGGIPSAKAVFRPAGTGAQPTLLRSTS